MTANRDWRSTENELTDKALNKALRRLPTGGWDSRHSRQSLSACFLFDGNPVFARAQWVIEQPARFDRLYRLALELPDTRRERIEQLKQEIAAGRYSPHSYEIAGRMLLK